MQFSGGYLGPRVHIPLSLVAAITTGLVWVWKCLTIVEALILFFGLEGPVLLACAFSPIGEVPPQGNLFEKLRWFFRQQDGVPVQYNKPKFYGGLLCLFIASILANF
jgi:hypothetical protein